MKKLSLNIVTALIGCLSVLPVFAQNSAAELQVSCTVEPVYHCAERMDDGGYIGHFGYRFTCPGADEPVAEHFIQIGDDNYFSPEPIDRGQPKVFVTGEHVDEFEVEFTAQEVDEGNVFSWTVLKLRIPVDLSITQDALLDCAKLPY